MKIVPAVGICLGFFSLLSQAQEVRKSLSPHGVEAGAFSVSTRKDSIGSVPVGNTKTDSVTVTNTGNTTSAGWLQEEMRYGHANSYW